MGNTLYTFQYGPARDAVDMMIATHRAIDQRLEAAHEHNVQILSTWENTAKEAYNHHRAQWELAEKELARIITSGAAPALDNIGLNIKTAENTNASTWS